MRVQFDVPNDIECMEALVLGLSAVNAVLLRKWTLPRLYDTDVVYKREPPRREDWWNVLEVLGHGFGDCEDLVAYRIGECLIDRTPAKPRIYRSGRGKLHVVVEFADGTIEDPSRLLGMGERKRR